MGVLQPQASIQVATTMTCTYCQSANSESDHRCGRCGRRLTGSAVSAPAGYQSTAGANALAMERDQEAERKLENVPVLRVPRTAQPSLFVEESAPRVIPFDAQQRQSLLQSSGLKTSGAKKPLDSNLDETSELRIPQRRSPSRANTRRSSAAELAGEQSTLDFLPNVQQTVRTLGTKVEAVIYCDDKVAAPLHRAMAALLDASMIILGIGIFLIIFQIFGGPFLWTRGNMMIGGSAIALIAMLYGFVWALCGRETAGMRWTGLRITTFNGFAPDGKSRALRLVGCWLSFCSGLIGIFWALVDEENLTWHDHMSKTFPTFQETNATLVRQPR